MIKPYPAPQFINGSISSSVVVEFLIIKNEGSSSTVATVESISDARFLIETASCQPFILFLFLSKK